MSRRPSPTVGAAAAARRFERVDALRGAAVVWMAVFHFCFDLDHFGFIRQDFHRDPWWTVQRSCIVSLFLFCAGLGQALALRDGPAWPPVGARFWRRWTQVAAGALAVSLGSWWMFPNSFIHFGVLHGIAAMLLVVRGLAAALSSPPTANGRLAPGWRWWALGAVALALPPLSSALWPVVFPTMAWPAVLDTRALNGLGLVSRKPVTEDYVPLLPWLGVVLWGVAAGRWLLARRPGWIDGGLGAPLRPLAVLGRWSLSFYLLHQPVLIGLLMLAAALRSGFHG